MLNCSKTLKYSNVRKPRSSLVMGNNGWITIPYHIPIKINIPIRRKWPDPCLIACRDFTMQTFSQTTVHQEALLCCSFLLRFSSFSFCCHKTSIHSVESNKIFHVSGNISYKVTVKTTTHWWKGSSAAPRSPKGLFLLHCCLSNRVSLRLGDPAHVRTTVTGV